MKSLLTPRARNRHTLAAFTNVQRLVGKVARRMPRCDSEPVPDWWDDELDVLLQRSLAVFGEDATDDTVVRMTEYYCHDVGDVRIREAFVPVLVESLKAEFRRVLTPH